MRRNPTVWFITVVLFGTLAWFAYVTVQRARQRHERDVNLIQAVNLGDFQAVRTLIDKSADVNAKDKYGASALHWAAIDGYTEIAGLLLDRGANIDARYGKNGISPLMGAVQVEQPTTVELLLKRGADINARGFGGRTSALRLALQMQYLAMLDYAMSPSALHAKRKKDTDAVVRLLESAGATG